MTRFVGQEPPLVLQAAAISSEGAIRTDDAMAGDDNRNRVGTIRGADRPAGALAPDERRELSVGRGAPGRDGPERFPHFLLERGAASDNGNVIDGMEVTLEVRLERALDRGRGWCIDKRDGPVVRVQDPAQLVVTVSEVERAKGGGLIRDDEECRKG